MSGIDFLADTNALIYLLSGRLCMKPFLSAHLGVSVISEIELRSFHDIAPEEVQTVQNLLQVCRILPVSDSVKEKTIELRRMYQIKLPDAIIAATSVVHEIPLLTADKGFSKIRELQLKLLIP